MSKLKKTFSIVKKAVWGAFLGLFCLVTIVTLWLTVDKFILKSPVPSMFGYATLTVETGSMAGMGEEAINIGDMIVIKKQKEYKVGDVITYLHEGDRVPTTHRIISINREDGSFVTKGDANNSKDPEGVTEDIIIGKVVRKLEGMGVFATWVRTEGWIYIVACFGILGLGLFVLASNDDEEDTKDEKTESDKAEPDTPADTLVDTAEPDVTQTDDQSKAQEE